MNATNEKRTYLVRCSRFSYRGEDVVQTLEQVRLIVGYPKKAVLATVRPAARNGYRAAV